MNEATLCAACGGTAIARLHDEWLCGRCGLDRTGRSAPSASGRGAVRAALGTGIVAKVLIGAAALAAIGGTVAADEHFVGPQPLPAPSTTVAPGPPAGPPPQTADAADAAPAGTPAAPQAPATLEQEPGAQDGTGRPEAVAAYVAAVHAWSACIDGAIEVFTSERPSGGGFAPFDECGDRPAPEAFGLARRQGPKDGTGRPDDPGARADATRRGPPQGARPTGTPGHQR